MPSDFTIPGENRWPPPSIWPAPSCAGPSAWPSPSRSRARWCCAYLNRLSDLLWAMARWQEGPEHKLSKRQD